jgi:hypothetical protein
VDTLSRGLIDNPEGDKANNVPLIPAECISGDARRCLAHRAFQLVRGLGEGQQIFGSPLGPADLLRTHGQSTPKLISHATLCQRMAIPPKSFVNFSY